MKLSNCHNAPVTMGGVGDFDDRDRVSTQYYVCSTCSKPCDLADTKDNWLEKELIGMYDYMRPEPDRLEKAVQAITRRMEQEKLELLEKVSAEGLCLCPVCYQIETELAALKKGES